MVRGALGTDDDAIGQGGDDSWGTPFAPAATSELVMQLQAALLRWWDCRKNQRGRVVFGATYAGGPCGVWRQTLSGDTGDIVC